MIGWWKWEKRANVTVDDVDSHVHSFFSDFLSFHQCWWEIFHSHPGNQSLRAGHDRLCNHQDQAHMESTWINGESTHMTEKKSSGGIQHDPTWLGPENPPWSHDFPPLKKDTCRFFIHEKYGGFAKYHGDGLWRLHIFIVFFHDEASTLGVYRICGNPHLNGGFVLWKCHLFLEVSPMRNPMAK